MKKLSLILTLVFMFCMSTTMVMADPGPYDPTMSVDGYDEDGADLIPTPANNDSIENPEVYEAINHILLNATGVSPGFTTNAETDSLQVTTTNSYWKDIAGAGESSNFAIVSITAGNENTLGVFKEGDLGSLTFFDAFAQTGFKFLGSGTMADPYPGLINPFPAENFGFALKSKNFVTLAEQIFYSDDTLNDDLLDHMLAFKLEALEGKTIYIDTNGDAPGGVETIVFAKDSYVLAWEDLLLSDQGFDSDYDDTIYLVTRVAPVPEPMTMMLFGSGLLGLFGIRRKKELLS